jgi:hypothetical protein
VYILKAAERAASAEGQESRREAGFLSARQHSPLPAEGEGERPAMAAIHADGLEYWIESLILAQDKRWRRA